MKFNVMGWSLCKDRFIREVHVSGEKISAIVERALKRLRRAENGDDISFIVEDYYEVIKELLVAYMLRDGMRSKNHQCLISYFILKNPNYYLEAGIIQQMSYFRNMLNYYGKDVPEEFYEKNKDEFKKIVELILGMIKEKDKEMKK
jgi:hypothetical protein